MVYAEFDVCYAMTASHELQTSICANGENSCWLYAPQPRPFFATEIDAPSTR